MNLAELRNLAANGEGHTLELKRTTGEVREGMETLCAFLNTAGGTVLFGVNRKGEAEGQQVSEQTIHEVTSAFERFEPPVVIGIERIKVAEGREVVALSVQANHEGVPYTFDGRAFERIGNTTRKMSQERYETLLLERAHARRRWENQPAVDVRMEDLDHEEILRTRAAGIDKRRISAGTSTDVGDILDRLGLRRNGVITQAAQILYGTRWLPDYPQGMLKLGRFRGTKITGDILDNKQEHLHAFAIVREAMAWLDRTLPLAARFPQGKIFRDDRLPVPAGALRETLLNAVMHRDYSDPGSYVAIAVFDDRIEVRSTGRLPRGVTAESLSGAHKSVLRNPLIAETFHRTGAVEIWGRGTNRVIEECAHHGIAPPTFEEVSGGLFVTFKAPIGPAEQMGVVEAKLGARARRILSILEERGPLGSSALLREIGEPVTQRSLQTELRRLRESGLIASSGKGRATTYRMHGEGSRR